MKLEVGKFYRTRDGRKAQIYAIHTNQINSLGVHGSVQKYGGEWGVKSWNLNGMGNPFLPLSDIVCEWGSETTVSSQATIKVGQKWKYNAPNAPEGCVSTVVSTSNGIDLQLPSGAVVNRTEEHLLSYFTLVTPAPIDSIEVECKNPAQSVTFNGLGKCECGGSSVGAGHSPWCPAFERSK